MALLWHFMLYGYIVNFAKISIALELPFQPPGKIWRDVESSKNYISKPHILKTARGDLESADASSVLRRSSNQKIAKSLMKALKDDEIYRGYTKRDHPVTFLFHRTLQKIEGGPSKFVKDADRMLEDHRVRVAPLGLESIDRPDMPLEFANLVDLNSLIANANHYSGNSSKLNCFLGDLPKSKKHFINSIPGNKSSKLIEFTNSSNKYSSELNERKKRDTSEVFLNSFPFSYMGEGFCEHHCEKIEGGHFRPDQFIMEISKDPSFSSFSEIDDKRMVDKINENTSNKHEVISLSKDSNETVLHEPATSNDSLTNASFDKRRKDKMHQSTEEAVFKNVLNELIAGMPNDSSFSTKSPLNSLGLMNADLKNSDINEIKSRIKAAKHAASLDIGGTTTPKDGPCMKIRVKNGPVVLTFLSDGSSSVSTKRPFTDPSNVPVFRLMCNRENSDSAVNMTRGEPVVNDFMARLAEDVSSGDFSKDLTGKANITNYFSGDDFESEKSNYMGDNVFSNLNYSLRNRSALLDTTTQLNESSSLIQKFTNSLATQKHDFMANEEEPKLSRFLSSSSSHNPRLNASPTINSSMYWHSLESSRTPCKPASVSCPIRTDTFILPDFKVQSFALPRNMFLSRAGSDAYRMAYLPYYYRVGNCGCHNNTDPCWRYVPRLYYNDLVVSKGLVGQHPSRSETSKAMLSDNTLKKMEMLNILKFYLDSLSPEKSYSYSKPKELADIHPLLNQNRKYFIKV